MWTVRLTVGREAAFLGFSRVVLTVSEIDNLLNVQNTRDRLLSHIPWGGLNLQRVVNILYVAET